MKNRHAPIFLALGLAVGYTGLLAAAISLRGVEPVALVASAEAAESASALRAEAPAVRTPTTHLRLRMTLPFVPAGSVRPETLQEI